MIRFVSASFIRSSSYYAEVSGGLSASLVSSSFITTLHSTIGTFDTDPASSAIELILPSQSTGASNDIKALFISSSGENPRVGIGTSSPLKAFDFKEVRDDNRGGEILIRGSRNNVGAQNNDEVGRINFAIDSASFGKIDISGSAAEIVALVDSVDYKGIQGHLSLRASATKIGAPTEILKLSHSVSVFNTPLDVNGTLDMGFYTIKGQEIESYNNPFTSILIGTNNINFKANTVSNQMVLTSTKLDANVDIDATNYSITSSNALISGDITATNGSFSGNVTVEGDIIAQNYIVSSSVTYMTQSFSSGSTIFGDTLDDTHQFTGSLDITGSLTVSEEIETNTISNVTTVIGSDSATNVDTFNSSSYNGAIYDYILKDTGVGARAGQFMVAHDDGSVTFTDTSTKHLTDSTIPEITADINGGDVRVRVTNGNGYTFKSFVKKL